MARKLLLALLALVFAQPLLAQSFPYPQPSETVPSDLPAFVYQAPTWTTDGTQNNTVDPNVTPPTQTGLAEINPTTNTTGMATPFAGAGATFTGASISGTTLTVPSDPTFGTIKVGDVVYGSGLPAGEGPAITQQNSGTTGHAGSYTIATNEGTVAAGGITGTTSPNFCLTKASGITGGTCTQAKFRTISSVTEILPDDPIKSFCQPGTSHLHEFFGNIHTNACSTYGSLRNRCASHSAGYCLNATGYWFPAPVKKNPFGDGFDYAVRANSIVVYYLQNSPSLGNSTAQLVLGLRYIFGHNVDDPDYTMLQAYANSLVDSTLANRYSALDSNGHYANQPVYQCNGATPNQVYVLQNADGSDPFGGTCNGAVITGYIDNGTPGVAGNTLHVTAVQAGTLSVGEPVTGTNASSAPSITAVVHAWDGTTGTYTIGGSAQLVASKTLYPMMDFFINLSGPPCWDAKNMWSPGGMTHVYGGLVDNKYGGGFTCGSNAYRLPQLTQEIHFPQTGFSDYGSLRLSSDDMVQSKLDGFPICTSTFSNAPCARGATVTGSISGSTLNITAISVGSTVLPGATNPGLQNGLGFEVTGTGITGHPIILAGPAGGGNGGYTLGGTLNAIGSTTSGSNQITNLGDNISAPVVGVTVTGAGIPAGTTVSAFSGTTVTISNNATATATGEPLSFGTWVCSGACATGETLRVSEFVPSGWSMHEDWLGAWDKATFGGANGQSGWMTQCVGTLNGNTPHECNTSQFNANSYLVGGYVGESLPDGFTIPADHTMFDTSVPAHMFKIAPTPHGMPTNMPTNN